MVRIRECIFGYLVSNDYTGERAEGEGIMILQRAPSTGIYPSSAMRLVPLDGPDCPESTALKEYVRIPTQEA